MEVSQIQEGGFGTFGCDNLAGGQTSIEIQWSCEGNETMCL